MKKGIKLALIIIISIITAVAACLGGLFLAKSVELSSLSKLQMADAPEAKYEKYIPDTSEIYSWVKQITDLGVRQPGTENGRKAAEYVAKKFRSFGLTGIDFTEGKTKLWTADKWSLKISGIDIHAYYMTHSFDNGTFGRFSTPDGGLNAQVVYAGKGTDADFRNLDVRGKIVVSDVLFSEIPVSLMKIPAKLFYDPEGTIALTDTRINPYSANTYPDNYYNAMKNGAAGFIGILANYFESDAYNNEDYSYLGGAMTIPGMWVSKANGEKIKVLISRNEKVQACMQLSGEIKNTTGTAVSGILPGTSKEMIMIHSHHDSATTGAVEDASGTSAVLALAEFFSRIPQSERTKTLLFTTMDTHFTGYDVHDAFIEKHLNNTDTVLADVCIEHIAEEFENRNGKITDTGLPEFREVFTSGSQELIDIVKEEIVRHHYARTCVIPATLFGDEVPTDADEFYQKGIPIISLLSGPLYLYDSADTLDKVAVNQLQPTVKTFAAVILRLSQLNASQFKPAS